MKIKNIILILYFGLVNNNFCYSQCQTINLIKNPSLEEYTCCPTNMTMISCADYWTQPLSGLSTSDYFNTCAIDSLMYPPILPFYLHPLFGNGYGGIHCDLYTSPVNYREYLQGTLNEPLEANRCYYLEFWTLLSGFVSTHGMDAIGVFLSDTLLNQLNVNTPLFYTAQVSNPIGRIISDTINWTKITGNFKANGGEKYFTIGTFVQENLINWVAIKPPYPGTFSAYYFFDNLA